MAAIAAARAGATVCLLERQDRVGRKLLATGNGQCNLSHTAAADVNYHGGLPGFVAPALGRFGVRDTLAFFNDLGILTTVEDDGEVYPACRQASAVLDVLRYEADRLHVRTVVGADVSRVVSSARGFTVISGGGRTLSATVILAPGGKAMPQLGGGESGIRLAVSLGHRLVPAFAALVPLKTDCPYNRQLKGTKVDATVTLAVAGGRTRSERGEVLFTEYGVSGPPVIQLSLTAARALHDGRAVQLTLDLFDGWDEQALAGHLRARFEKAGDAPLEQALIGLCHKRLIPALLGTAGLPRAAAAASSDGFAPRLAATCKAWRLTVTGSLSYNEAHVMCGGIDCADVDPDSLQSRRVEGLFLTGELLDVTGDCGGYNLQWAWSSGHLAGERAAQCAEGRRRP
jgi:predicted Rossmann fold flavoprotein